MLRRSRLPGFAVQASQRPLTRGFASSVPNRFSFHGPIEATAQLFHSIHDVTGLTYGITIPLTAILLRTAITLPLVIYSQKKLNRRIELRPLFYHWGEIIGLQAATAYQKKHKVDLRKDKEALAKTVSRVTAMVKNRMKVIYERHGATKLRIILPSVVQIPLFILVSLALRAMSGWTGWYDVGMTAPMEPLLRAEGFGAIQDLTRPDGSYVLPVLIGLMGITNVELTAARRAGSLPAVAEQTTRLAKVTRVSLLTISALMIPIAMQAPAAISLYWATSAGYSVAQNLLIQRYLPTTPPHVHVPLKWMRSQPGKPTSR